MQFRGDQKTKWDSAYLLNVLPYPPFLRDITCLNSPKPHFNDFQTFNNTRRPNWIHILLIKILERQPLQSEFQIYSFRDIASINPVTNRKELVQWLYLDLLDLKDGYFRLFGKA